MKLSQIQVECDAGHKADGAPRRFFWEGEWLEVAEVRDRRYEAGEEPEWPAADFFKVLASDGCEYLLKHGRECDEWFLARRR